MLSDWMDDKVRRSLLLRLAEIVLNAIKPKDGKFDHQFMSSFEAATWLICTLQLAERTPTGFEALAPEADREGRVASVPEADLPLLEDAIEAALMAYDFYFTIPKHATWPPDPDMFPAKFNDVFEDLGLKEKASDWSDAALPILLWNECLAEESLGDTFVAGSIRNLAWQAMETMPPRVVEVLTEDELRGRPGQRLVFAISDNWRPDGWLTPTQRQVARTYVTNPLARTMAAEIVRIRASAN